MHLTQFAFQIYCSAPSYHTINEKGCDQDGGMLRLF